MKSFRVFAFLFAFALLAAPLAQAEPFVGENLTYEFGWSGFTAARAEVSIGSINYDGDDCYNIKIEVRSLARLDWIWKVRDKLTSYPRKSDLLPKYFFWKQREGKYNLDTEIKHDKQVGVLRSKRTRYKDDKIKPYKDKWTTAAGRLDPLGSLLHMRSQDLKVGGVYNIKVFEGKREHDIRYEVVSREKLTTKFGELDTFAIIPRVVKSSKGGADKIKVEKVSKVKIWLTTTPEHMIVRVESKAWIGAVFAELVKK